MTVYKKIAGLEDELEGLQYLVVRYPNTGELEMLYQVTFPRMFESAEKLKSALGDIDMYDKVKDGLARTEALAREGKYEEAQDCVLALNRELMEASGTAEALRKRFPSKN